MKRGHLEALRPLCPRCLVGGGTSHVVLGSTVVASADDVLEGILHCPTCLMEYPVLDGIPYLVADLRAFVRDSLSHLLAREPVSQELESLLGDAAGPSTYFDVARQFTSSYAWDHWADQDPTEEPGGAPGAIVRALRSGLASAGPAPAGPGLDLGCSVGRASFELAHARGDALVLGGDLSVPMLRLARRVLTTGQVVYSRRRIGLVYDRRSFPVAQRAPNLDFWAFDASAPPFAAGTFAVITGFNVLDVVASPLALLQSVERLLVPEGRAVLTTPFDWSQGATPYEAWIGGHSQRGPWQGAAEPLLRALLGGAHPQALHHLELVAEHDVDWHVRMHSRSMVQYRGYLAAVRRR